jgi:hypothetical protein
MLHGVSEAPSLMAWRLPWPERDALALAGLAAVLAALLLGLGPPGTDVAAHVFQRELYAAHGFSLWNNLWYSGRYSFVTYSLLYYPVVAAVGIRLLAAVCVVVAVIAFDAIVRRRWGAQARWASRSMAIVLPGIVLTGAFPFLLGFSLGLVALLAAGRRQWPAFATLCALAAAASPLAFAFVAIAVLAFVLGDRWDRTAVLWGASALGGVAAVLVVLARLFATQSHDPFPTRAYLAALASSVALAGLAWKVPDARPLRCGALLNAGACTVAFAVSSNVGEGITRLRFVALPVVLLALALKQWRPLPVAIVAVVLAAYWNVAPLVTSFAIGVADPSAQAAYWRPAVRFLQIHMAPAYRVEVVDTEHHWAAAYLPLAGIPLARGWFRQDDFPQNGVLYAPLTADRYARWLRSLGVAYVVLTDMASDYSARREAALLRGGSSGLHLAFRSRHLEIFRLPSARPIVTGPGDAHVLAFERQRIVVRLTRPGIYRVAVKSSPYWHTSGGCLRRAPDDMLRLSASRPGTIRITFGVTLSRVLDAAAGDAITACAKPVDGGVGGTPRRPLVR